MALSDDVLEGVLDIATEVGKTLTIRRITQGEYIDPTHPGKGRLENTDDYSALGIITDYEDSMVDGNIILATDKRAIISLLGITLDEISASITPTIHDLIIDGDDTWNIVHVNLSELSGVQVVCILQLRR